MSASIVTTITVNRLSNLLSRASRKPAPERVEYLRAVAVGLRAVLRRVERMMAQAGEPAAPPIRANIFRGEIVP